MIQFKNKIEVKWNHSMMDNKPFHDEVSKPFVEVTGDFETSYNIRFESDGELLHSTIIQNNMWVDVNLCYPKDVDIWITEAFSGIEKHYKLELTKDSKVLCYFNSNAMGDAIAWVNTIQKWVEEKGCQVDIFATEFICSLFKNGKNEIKNVVSERDVWGGPERKGRWEKYDFIFGVGQYEDNKWLVENKRRPENPHPREITLQEVPSSILGIETNFDRPEINPSWIKEPTIDGDYVCIATHSTLQAKYWNKIGGWDYVVPYLNLKGYKVVSISLESGIYCGNKTPKTDINKTGYIPISDRVNDLHHCKFFIGLPSGLSWLAWALNKPVLMVGNYSKPYSEFQDNVVRVYKEGPYTGIYNDTSIDIQNKEFNYNPYIECKDLSDWNDIETIDTQDVFDGIDKLIDIYL